MLPVESKDHRQGQGTSVELNHQSMITVESSRADMPEWVYGVFMRQVGIVRTGQQRFLHLKDETVEKTPR